jgi:DNA-binding transcriptional ArsR family regulator
MLQAIGRARSFQDDGIPVIVCSNEPLGLPVESESRQTPKLSNRAQQVWNWLELDIAKSLSNTLYTFGNITTGEVSRYLGMSRSQASKGLGELAKSGYVTKLAHGKWRVTEVAIANITVVVPEREQHDS